MPIPPIKAKVDVGQNAVEKLVDAAVDAFSPATETLGLLGDAVRLARVELAATVTRRAKSIADQEGLKLTAPPLKFLIPFYEKASAEDGDDVQLVEMWSRLLASAGADYNSKLLRYSSMLAELSGDQVRILDSMMRNFGGVGIPHYDVDAMFYGFVESRLTRDLKSLLAADADELLNKVLEKIALPGVAILLIAWEMNEPLGGYYDWDDDPVYDDSESINFEILRSMGIIERVT